MRAKTARQLIEIPTCAETVPKPHLLGRRKLLFERKQLPQVADIRHFRIELMERLEPEHIFRNQQVACCRRVRAPKDLASGRRAGMGGNLYQAFPVVPTAHRKLRQGAGGGDETRRAGFCPCVRESAFP